MMVIVDTSVWIDYFAGKYNAETDWLNRQSAKFRLGITDLILCEYLQGMRSDADYFLAKTEMKKYQLYATGGEKLAIAAAENYRLLGKKGITPRKTIDCWIATFCLLEGFALLHRDRDFDSFEKALGLRVVKPNL
jgi:predicted nucleic acid-binding protein